MIRGTKAAAVPRDVVAYVIGTYPLLTTTFIDREIELLRSFGQTIDVVALRRPHGRLSPAQVELADAVEYVLPVSPTALLRSHARVALRRPGTLLRLLVELLAAPHSGLRSRLMTVLHIGEGVHVAHLLRARQVGHVHAHFVDRAAVVGIVASRLLDCTFSATAHANDIYVEPVLLPEKIARSSFVVTCTEFNAAHLRSVVPVEIRDRVVRVYHGLDLGRYEPARDRPAAALLAVGQLKEKKGYADLLTACRLLRDRGHEFTCQIVGEGPLRSALEEQIDRSSLGDVVTLRGALAHDEVLEAYRSATVFTLPCTTAADGDRDGIPNVILEAMAMGLPVVSTRHSGIPEVVVDGISGVLVPPGEPAALASALARLLEDPHECTRMGRRGRQRVAEAFDITANAKELLARFEEVLA